MILRYTLFCEGSSDVALLPILDWMLKRLGVNPKNIEGQWGDLRNKRSSYNSSLKSKLLTTVQLYPCDLLFIHQDADSQTYETTHETIRQRVVDLENEGLIDSSICVCVIPVRMTETWLMINPNAIRRASGNKNGTVPLDLPSLNDLESIADPKGKLQELLCVASELRGRKLKRMNVGWCKTQIPHFIDDFSELLSLPAFNCLNDDLGRFIRDNPQFI